MPRVNKDLQRRLAARRERERRRPTTERRYRFQTSTPTDAELEALDGDSIDGAADSLGPAAPARSRRDASRVGHTERVSRPFADYAVEYAYVARDLRRLGLVVGAILIVLLVLYFILPR